MDKRATDGSATSRYLQQPPNCLTLNLLKAVLDPHTEFKDQSRPPEDLLTTPKGPTTLSKFYLLIFLLVYGNRITNPALNLSDQIFLS